MRTMVDMFLIAPAILSIFNHVTNMKECLYKLINDIPVHEFEPAAYGDQTTCELTKESN